MAADNNATLLEAQLVSISQVLAITITTLHAMGQINGRNIAKAIRINATAGDPALAMAMADHIDRAIDKYEKSGPAGLSSVD